MVPASAVGWPVFGSTSRNSSSTPTLRGFTVRTCPQNAAPIRSLLAMPADASVIDTTPTLAGVSPDVLHQLADVLNELMLPSNRGRLCAPVIAAAPGIIDGQTYFVLSTLARTGPVTVAQLAQHLGIDRSGTRRYADRLQQAGLLERRPDPADRRMSLLGLTLEGTRLARQLGDGLA